MYLKYHCITLPNNHVLSATMGLMFPVLYLTNGEYWIFNQVQVMGFQILQVYVIDVSCFQICSILSLNVILCWEAHFLGWLPDFYIALQAFNVFNIFLPCLIFWKCCFSLCWKQWLIIYIYIFFKGGTFASLLFVIIGLTNILFLIKNLSFLV